MRATTAITYGIISLLLAIIGYGFLWQSTANTLKNRIETELESLEYAIEKRGGQLNYGLISISGFPTGLTVKIDKFSMRYYKDKNWVSLALPETISLHKAMNSALVTVQLPKVIQLQTQYASQNTAISYVLESSYHPELQLVLPASIDLNKMLSNWQTIESALTHFKLSLRDSTLAIQTKDSTLVYQQADAVSFDYHRVSLADSPNDQYQFNISLVGYTIKDAIDLRWLKNMPYYYFFSRYFHNAQPLQAQCDLIITGPKEWTQFFYQNSSYQVNQCEITNQTGKIALSSQLAFFQSKHSPKKGTVQIEISNYLEMLYPLLQSAEATLALPILQSYIPSIEKPQASLASYQQLFLNQFFELGRESENGKNFSILLQFQDNKVLIRDDSVEKKLPRVLQPLRAIQEMQRPIQKNKTTRVNVDRAI